MNCNKTINFLKEIKRCCGESFCDKCPLEVWADYDICKFALADVQDGKFEELINAIQKWSDKHSQKTYRMDFLEHFPNASIDENDTPRACRQDIYGGKCLVGAPSLVPLSSSEDQCSFCWNEEIK